MSDWIELRAERRRLAEEVKKELKRQRIPVLSVRWGRGTDWGWLYVKLDPLATAKDIKRAHDIAVQILRHEKVVVYH